MSSISQKQKKYTEFLSKRNREIYLEYTGFKNTPKKSAPEIADKYDISRQRVYSIVGTVKNKLLKGEMTL